MRRVIEPLTLGVDLGGTKLKTALVDGGGKIIVSHRHPTDTQKGPKKIISDIVTCVKDCLGEEAKGAVGLGIGVAGQVDADSGIVCSAPNLRWENVHLREELKRALKISVVVTNDVRAATWGEWLHGVGKGAEDLLCLFVGTGIGGGVVSGGRLLKGYSNTAGEIGHITIAVDGRKCRCPNTGCLEAYAGGWAIAERAQESVRRDPVAGKRLVSIAGSIMDITAATVSHAYKVGDSLASNLIEETGRYLSSGIVGLVNAFNPCIVILGGGVIESLPILIEMVDRGVRERALDLAKRSLRIVKASLGENAGVIGASMLPRN